jgi:hypothetical protein
LLAPQAQRLAMPFFVRARHHISVSNVCSSVVFGWSGPAR